jgi:ABC-2 type transport system permease protein
MHKILIVLKSEFLRRVMSKWFIITTLLGPVLMLLLFGLPTAVGILATRTDQRQIVVIDETGKLLPALQEQADPQLTIVPVASLWAPGVGGPAVIDSVRNAVRAGRFDGYLHLPASLLQGENTATFYSAEGAGLALEGSLDGLVRRVVEEQRLADSNAPPDVLEILRADLSVRKVKLTDEGEAADSTLASSAIGYFMGFLIYITVFIYGAYVMQGVMDEKQSRVVEVVISSVRPFQLLMGKVLGIGAMGLVQMLAWSILMLLLTTFAGNIVALFLDPADFDLPTAASQQEVLQAANFELPSISPAVFIWLPLFFLGGYLLYASLFAAVGSAVEQQQDAQGLMAPITMLIVLPILFVMFVIATPNAPLSVALSLFPFFSPILMMARIAVTDVPFWQVLLAYLLLTGTFLGTMWLSSRIYRVGILMYGKKPTLKDLARWIRYA